MPERRSCPRCAEFLVRMLDVPSQRSEDWHFHCDGCGHRWKVPKDEAMEPNRRFDSRMSER